jgi:hypothetical protein
MRIPRATFGPSRAVSDPDGRTWTVRVVHYRLPQPGEEADEPEESFPGVTELIRTRSFWLRLVVGVPIVLIVWRYSRLLSGGWVEGEVLFRVVLLGLAVLLLVAGQYLFPLLDATIGHLPWIVATAENPPVRMVWRVWRATSRRSVREVVDEIAAGLERGDPPSLSLQRELDRLRPGGTDGLRREDAELVERPLT